MFFVKVVFGILGNPGILDISKDSVCRQVCLFSGMPGFVEVVLRPKIILEVLQLRRKPIKKMLISLDLHGKLIKASIIILSR